MYLPAIIPISHRQMLQHDFILHCTQNRYRVRANGLEMTSSAGELAAEEVIIYNHCFSFICANMYSVRWFVRSSLPPFSESFSSISLLLGEGGV